MGKRTCCARTLSTSNSTHKRPFSIHSIPNTRPRESFLDTSITARASAPSSLFNEWNKNCLFFMFGVVAAVSWAWSICATQPVPADDDDNDDCYHRRGFRRRRESLFPAESTFPFHRRSLIRVKNYSERAAALVNDVVSVAATALY
jgi:hypothetical protein